MRKLASLTAFALAAGLTAGAYADQNGNGSSNAAIGLLGPAAAEDSLATKNYRSTNEQWTIINSAGASQTWFGLEIGNIDVRTAVANSELSGAVVGVPLLNNHDLAVNGDKNGHRRLVLERKPMRNTIGGSNDPVGISQISQNAGYNQLTQQSVVVQASSVVD